MTRILLTAMIIWNMLFGQAAEPHDWANKAFYAQENTQLLVKGNDPQRVVLMGNSITQFWREKHPDFFENNDLVGRGISGQVSSQMLARFRQDVINLNPCAVVINCGTNDIAENNGPYDEDITMDNIKTMTEIALDHGIKVILSSVLPCNAFTWRPDIKDASDKIQHLNQRIAAYATAMGLSYIDYWSAMARHGDGALIPAFGVDGVHPSSAGYDVMERLLGDTLKSVRE